MARTPIPALHRIHTLHQARTPHRGHHQPAAPRPAWHDTLSLSDLHRQNLHPREAATRLGAMPRRLLPSTARP
ncbi:hypothetical protein QBB31_00005 [Streptomyces scabiei]|uniref:hypothetical protein n=1 Tax=Streptomyces scabiei TaxID=1930 RepID=UPI002FF0B915